MTFDVRIGAQGERPGCPLHSYAQTLEWSNKRLCLKFVFEIPNLGLFNKKRLCLKYVNRGLILQLNWNSAEALFWKILILKF